MSKFEKITDGEAYRVILQYRPKTIEILDDFIQKGMSLEEIQDRVILTGYAIATEGLASVNEAAGMAAITIMAARHMYNNYHEIKEKE